ncbi:hypothetical protein LTR49_020066 [Elasticomyces elasticus]|nr:hypothetical protein LTR49_020066 [Elasticomyces elasticus]
MSPGDSSQAVLPNPRTQPESSSPASGPMLDQGISERQSSTSGSAPDNGDTLMRRHLVEMLSQEDIDQRVIEKGVRVTYVGQEFSNINYLVRHRAQNGAVFHYPSNQLPRRYTTHELDRIPSDAFMLPPRPIVDELLEQYFLHINPGCPIVDEELFMGQYRARDPDNPPSLLVLQAALMVGAHVSKERPERDELKATFFRRAKMLFDARFEWNLDSMVQAALLMTWHSETSEEGNSYHWVGVAVRTAFGLGMHRDCGPSTLIQQEKRIWKRLWWILVQYDAIVALSSGRPLAINLADADVPALERADLNGAIACLDSESVDQAIDFILHQTQLCCIIAQVVRERFGLNANVNQRKSALRRADQQLAEWQFQLPQSLRHGSSYRSTWSAMLHITYSNLSILLHRPSPTTLSNTTVVRPEDMEICALAAASMAGLFETVWRRKQLAHFNVSAVSSLFTGLIQLSAEMRVSNPVLVANAIRRFDTALDVLRALAEHWLNADIILRLFADSSERVRNELRLGRAALRTTASTTAVQPMLEGASASVEKSADWHDTVPLAGTTTDTPASGDPMSIDWTNVYWDSALLDFGNMTA